MKRRRRVIAAFILASLIAPGTWLRTDIAPHSLAIIEIDRVAGASATGNPAWRVAGVWHYAANTPLFGGFSALLPLAGGTLRAFSDRGVRWTFPEPGSGARRVHGDLAHQPFTTPAARSLPDTEAATGDPANGAYWLALERQHSIHRYSRQHQASGVYIFPEADLGWSRNSGAEAMIRLADGRFLIVPESSRTALLFADDPVDAPKYEAIPYQPPVPGFAATDLAELPDGRILLLMRNFDPLSGRPFFESKLAIADPPRLGEEWNPRIAIDLTAVVPGENYEGMAVRAMEDARVAVWLIADDNKSMLQRTLIAKLIFDPAASEQ